MKKILSLLLVAVVGLSSIGQGAMIDDAVSRLYTNGYTIFSNTRDYQPNNFLRRDEAAKFFVRFGKQFGATAYIKSVEDCQFNDLNDGHVDLKDIIIESCRLGIFKGYNGKFMPTLGLTNSQALAVMMRILYGTENELGWKYWAQPYYYRAFELGRFYNLIGYDNENYITRGNLAQNMFIWIQNEGDKEMNYTNETLGWKINYPKFWNIDEGQYLLDESLYCKKTTLSMSNGGGFITFIIGDSSEVLLIDGCSNNGEGSTGTTIIETWNTDAGPISMTIIENEYQIEFYTKNPVNLDGKNIFIYSYTPLANNRSKDIRKIISSLKL